MLIKLLPDQIPLVWDTIKFVIITVENVEEKYRQKYLNKVLMNLLDGDAQCFVRLNETRNIIGILITRFQVNKYTEEKYLYLQCVYSFKVVPDSVWKEDFKIVKKLAKKERCSYVSFVSDTPRIWELMKMIGFKEEHRVFKLQF